MPKISIITPVFIDISSKIDWLIEMIESVRSQTIADWELILIDDKSPLPLGEPKMRYAEDPRIRWLENAENYGPAKTRNTAVALAESDCILPLDSDDLLANPETLEDMYDAWLMDQTKIIYGDLEVYRRGENNQFERGRKVQLGEYTYELAMNLQGIMPVTAMHSKDCHYAAGGWKAELEWGLEDVEYWIAAGERGYCGQRINTTTLVYRRQEQSRAYEMNTNRQYRVMQDKIKAMHPDIYAGRFPMACCGKGGANAPSLAPDPAVLSQQARKARRITALEGYDEKDLEWVGYFGPKTGRFDVLIRGAANLPQGYTIHGTGHVFQIHKQHRIRFERQQRDKFQMNLSDPRKEPEPETTPQPTVERVDMPPPPQPKMATVVRLDRQAAETREVDIQPMPQETIIEPTPPAFVSDTMPAQLPTDHFVKQLHDQSVVNLGLSEALTQTLKNAGWTIPKLAETTPDSLVSLPNIGQKRAETIIDKAKQLI